MNRYLRRMSRRAALPAALLLALACGHALAAADADIQFPPQVQAKLQGLSQEQRDFVASSARIRRFGLTPEKLIQELERRDAAGVEAYVGGLMQVVEESRFHPGTDMAEIPLNKEAKGFNGSTVLRPPELDERWREPGPFSLNRYVRQQGGIPTFAGAPVAIRKEDLVAGKVEVAFVGVPLDMSSGWRDAKHAPRTLRAMYGLSGSDVNSLVDPTLVLNIADYGDLSVDNMSSERSIGHVRAMIGEMAGVGTIPFIVGGDQTIMYPGVAGIVDAYGKGRVGVIHLDANYEAVPGGVHTISDVQTVGRLVEEGQVSGANLIQVGLRGPSPDEAALKWMREQGLRYHTMAEVEKDGWAAVLERAIKEARQGADKLFVSFNISVLDPAYAPAAGRPVPGGLTTREALPIVRRLCAENDVVGFEMLDIAPILDPTYKTALNANAVMHACLTGIAMRKEGLTSAAYLNPLSGRSDSRGR